MNTQTLAARFVPLLPLLRCPLCGGGFRVSGGSMICASNHCYDFSRQGYINLAPAHNQQGEKYGAELFSARHAVLEAGFYRPLAEAAAEELAERAGGKDAAFSLLDVGCGEGYYTRFLRQAFPRATLIGADLSREAVLAAARAGNALPTEAGSAAGAFWAVADLKRLPLKDEALDAVLDVLTPADYGEFARVLKPGGLLIKVIPGENYLREIRDAVSPWLKGGAAYDNTPVLEHMEASVKILRRRTVCRTWPLTGPDGEALSAAFLRMTPMTFSVPEEALAGLRLEQITVEMEVIAGEIR